MSPWPVSPLSAGQGPHSATATFSFAALASVVGFDTLSGSYSSVSNRCWPLNGHSL